MLLIMYVIAEKNPDRVISLYSAVTTGRMYIIRLITWILAT